MTIIDIYPKGTFETRYNTRFIFFPEKILGKYYYFTHITVEEARRIETCYGYYNDWFPINILDI